MKFVLGEEVMDEGMKEGIFVCAEVTFGFLYKYHAGTKTKIVLMMHSNDLTNTRRLKLCRQAIIYRLVSHSL